MTERVLKLHLEMPLAVDEHDILVKYGKAEKGLYRDVLVPENLSLYQLHYIIQKAFGWRNSHLHHFKLPEKVFKKLTGNMFTEWGKYCGVLFRFPNDDFEDIYWADDYDGRVDPESWMRSKYRFRLPYRGISEHFLEAQTAYRDMVKGNPTIRKPVTFREFCENRDKGKEPKEEYIDITEATVEQIGLLFADAGGPDELLERLTVGELLTSTPRITKGKCAQLTGQADALYNENEKAFRKKWAGKSSKKKKTDFRYRMELSSSDPSVFPLTDQLHYEYDYGDGWEIEIFLLEEYDSPDNCPEEAKPVFETGRSVCVAADGLPVLDDVGGIWGYCEFLEALYGENDDPEDRAWRREWARDMGWTGRIKNPKNIL